MDICRHVSCKVQSLIRKPFWALRMIFWQTLGQFKNITDWTDQNRQLRSCSKHSWRKSDPNPILIAENNQWQTFKKVYAYFLTRQKFLIEDKLQITIKNSNYFVSFIKNMFSSLLCYFLRLYFYLKVKFLWLANAVNLTISFQVAKSLDTRNVEDKWQIRNHVFFFISYWSKASPQNLPFQISLPHLGMLNKWNKLFNKILYYYYDQLLIFKHLHFYWTIHLVDALKSF